MSNANSESQQASRSESWGAPYRDTGISGHHHQYPGLGLAFTSVGQVPVDPANSSYPSPIHTPDGLFESLRIFSPPATTFPGTGNQPSPIYGSSNTHSTLNHVQPGHQMMAEQLFYHPNSGFRHPAQMPSAVMTTAHVLYTPIPAPGSTIERQLEEDRRDAERELQCYEQAGLSIDASERTTDLVHFWEQKEHIYPLLFHVAMDVLPAQASSVPSERAFLSSKLTCTKRRDKLSLAIVEALQILKFSFKQDRLNFTPDLVADDRDYTISGPVTSRAVDE